MQFIFWRRSLFWVLCVSFAWVPVSTSAMPQQKKQKSPATNWQRPQNAYGTPSLSPVTGTTKRQPGSSPNSGRPTPANAGNLRQRSRGSVVPAPTNYRTGTARPPSGLRRSLDLNLSEQPANRQPGKRPGKRPANKRPAYKRPANNRPDAVIQRPDINFQRPTFNQPRFNQNVTNINNTTVNNTTVNNTSIHNNARVINQNNGWRGNYGRPGGNYRSSRAYYPQLHYHWRPSSWLGAYQPAFSNYGYATNISGSWLSVGGVNLSYVNPFYLPSLTTAGIRFDYSQPIHVPAPDYRESRDDLIRSERAIRRFDDARGVFRRGEYGRANDLIDEAIELLPSDPTLHQFRALVLFARQRYQEAAAVLYSVVAVSPGWDADTLAKLYDSSSTYLAQVRDLEQYVATHPQAIESQFLLAYHEVIKGDFQNAEKLLENVRVAQPNDVVIQSLLAALRG